ncbi:MAG: hypothetical protein M4579_007418 [Chaenotheca gracillima]|nr:MAG: hypothetical protein M4579_007418 [Chaenotheca gracillima]
MSRHFSFAARVAAQIAWTLKGTTKEIGVDLVAIEKALDTNPELAKKVKKGVINGDPHATKYADGTEDPIHISGVIGQGNLKGSSRATSFHYYPGTGDLRFSNLRYQPIRISTSNAAAESSSSSSGQSGAQTAFKEQARDWIWDDSTQKYRYWDGTQWIWQE